MAAAENIRPENIATKLNPVQIHLLEMFSKDMGSTELREIKDILTEYYKKKILSEVDAFWDKKEFTKESWNEATRDVHMRTQENSKG
jgi:hypothetical protein